MPEIIHQKSTPDGIRLKFSEPFYGWVRSHVPGLTYDHDHPGEVPVVEEGNIVNKPAYLKGDPVPYVQHHLSGQEQVIIPSNTNTVEFEDGTVHDTGVTPNA